MRRRQFLGLVGGAAFGLPTAIAQKPLPRIGFLASGAAASINSELQVRTLKRGLEENGLVEGRDYILSLAFRPDTMSVSRSWRVSWRRPARA
jgi:hypothetical protein